MTSRALGLGPLSGLALSWLAVACGTERIRLLERPDGSSSTLTRAKDGGAADGSSSAPPAVRGIERSACGKWTATITPDAALLMMVVDVSGSMTFMDPTSNGMTSKWGVERPILAATVDDFPPGLGVGVLYYPNKPTPASSVMRPASSCVNVDAMIPVDYLGQKNSHQRYVIQRSLASTEPNTQEGTPTLDAYLVALQALGSTTLAGSRQILLITDGQPTFSEGCVGTGTLDVPVDETPIIQAIAAAKRAGISTFIIGSPGSEQSFGTNADARPWLSRAAEAGGTARPGCSDNGPRYCHFDMSVEPNFGQGLTQALDEIAGSITRCDVPLPVPPPNQRVDFSRVNVVVARPNREPAVLTRNDSPACTDGWQFAPDRQHIRLCPNTCTSVRADPTTEVDVFIACTSTTPQEPIGTIPKGGQR